MKRKAVLFICLICVVAIGIYCLTNMNGKLLKIEVSNDYMMVDTLENANANAKYILKGQFVSYDKEWNMHRDDDDILKEHPYERMTGKIYSFKVSDILKGDIDDDTLSVNLKYSTRLFFNQNGLIHGEEIVNEKNVEYIDYKESAYTEPELNQDYILYLDYDKNFSLYYGAFQPYMIKVDHNQLSLQSNFVNGDTIAVNSYQLKSRDVEVKETLENVNNFVQGISLEKFIDLLKED